MTTLFADKYGGGGHEGTCGCNSRLTNQFETVYYNSLTMRAQLIALLISSVIAITLAQQLPIPARYDGHSIGKIPPFFDSWYASPEFKLIIK